MLAAMDWNAPTDDPRPRRPTGRGVAILHEGGSQLVPLPEEGTLHIGRAPECALRLRDGAVSRRHATLHITPDAVEVEDQGSRNGVDLAGARLPPHERVPWPVGTALRVGGAVLVLRPAVAAPTDTPEPLVEAPAMRALFDAVGRVAASSLPVLLLGETGVGKEVVAREVHRRSRRAGGPLVKVDCGALSAELVEAELFGHERGAFTGAIATRPGLLREADGGTVFLDEVGELPLDMQTRLLRVLQEGEVRPVGSTETLTLDLRFVAATHVDLTEAVRAGRFREDLFYWLQGAVLSVPPLRERVEDIAPLAERFLVEAARLAGRARVPALSEEARRALEAHGWPGNVRQLRNVVQRAVLLGGGDVVELADLDVPAAEEAASPVDLRTALEAFEKERIRDALEATGGNQTLAAKRLGVARRTLISRIEKYGLPRPRKGSDE